MVSFRSALEVNGRTLNWLRALALVLAFLQTTVRAEPPPVVPSETIHRWLAAQTNLQTWTAAFVQTRTLKALAQPLQAGGRVWFAAPNRFHWELGDPPQTIAVRSQEEMLVIYPNLKRAERYPLNGTQSGPWRDALALLEAGFPRSRRELESRFKLLGESETNGVVELSLQPRPPGARRMMPQVKVMFATNDFALRATELHFADGSTLRNDFHDAKANPPVDDTIFAPKISSGFKIVEPTRSP